MKGLVKSGWGRSMALALMLGSSVSAIALPGAAQSLPVLPISPLTVSMMMPHPLEQQVWQLVSYRDATGETVMAWVDSAATMQFEAGQVTGTTGCNRFFSAYTLAGSELAIAPGGSTLMACFPEALAQQESAILAGMATVASYEVVADELRLLDSAGDVVFTLAPQVAASLTQTDWMLTSYNNGRGGLVTPLLDTTITATFDDAGLVSGTAGCNTYRAHFEATTETLQIGPAASTRRLCQVPEGTMTQEQDFLALLADVSEYEIVGNQLTLLNAAGTVLAEFSTATAAM
ncbi:META domain-containing protein [Leptolyngbya iicbica]|uniref:META domain-containing protein n=2 Tax=Cyanophyceae TaxID=3028117 RepID=A0A4Q7EGZ4_9CYAN|nr:META domain-containing protein [Leptolyngbya sp. LK]RZM82625.1 META domain-containing protein [Leptolyngbya sp. LK]